MDLRHHFNQQHHGDQQQHGDGGAELLDEVHETLCRYVVWPDEHTSVAYTLWLAAAHAQNAWEHATRFVIKSPIKRCGKTRAQEIGRELAHRALSTVNISTAALVRSIDEDDPPTLFIDEADTIFAKRKGEAREGAEDLRGIINSGHSRGWPYVRWDMKARQSEECPTFAMALLAGIGDLPDTIEDRAVVVSMRRRAKSESVASFRRRRVVPVLHDLRDRLHAWVSNLEGLDDLEPSLPVDDRDADKWEPLVVIADAAGGHWPSTARAACLELCDAGVGDEATLGERLLADLHAVWPTNEEYLSTATILDRLNAIEDSPWGSWSDGKGIKAHELARYLRPYGVKSKTVRVGPEDTPKGYARADLIDPWARYTLPNDTSATPPHGDETGNLTSENGCGGSVAFPVLETATPSDLREHAHGHAVAAVAAERANHVQRPRHHPRLEALCDELDADLDTFEERFAALDCTDPDYWQHVADLRAADALRRRREATP
jgi:hypothetical protein